jgi:phage terminase large subunit
MEIQVTNVFERNWNALLSGTRYIENVGGSRSSKTYSLCQVLILWAIQNPNRVISIVRATGPALSASVQRDFIEVMNALELWDRSCWNVSDRCYTFPNGTIIEFFSADQEQKLRGRKRDVCWVNEANELGYDSFEQLDLRTVEKVFFDYNPSMNQSWLYEVSASQPEKKVTIHSTFLDNPFLEPQIVDKIMSYSLSDPSYYQIFALGVRAHSRENVFVEWKTGEFKEEDWDGYIYGLDFGFNHPMALIKIWYKRKSREVYLEEVIYARELTSTQIVDRMIELGVSRSIPIISETARPEITADIRKAGFAITNADKAVIDGINTVKTFQITISPTSNNIINENRGYKWQKINGILTDTVVKANDDAMDAIRYGLVYLRKHIVSEGNVDNLSAFTFSL